MNKTVMKVCLFGVAVVMMLVPTAMAGPIDTGSIDITRLQNMYSGGGGEFNITPTSGLLGIRWSDYVDGKTKNVNPTIGKDFESFCLEESEFVTIPGSYNAKINYVGAVLGGGGDKVKINNVWTDPISLGTAYLYSQFAAGTLSGYNYTVGAGRVTSAAALQNAIWYLEGEGGVNNSFVTLVATKFGTLAAAMANANGAYHVAVLNLTTGTGGLAQDQLVMAPEPASLLLFGIGLLGAATLRRKFRRS